MIHIAPVRIMPTLGVFGDILYSFAHNETMSVRSVFSCTLYLIYRHNDEKIYNGIVNSRL